MEETEKETEKPVEKRVVKCPNCLITQDYYFAGKFNNGRKRWVDFDGRLCNGKVCGGCNAVRAKQTMRKTREQRFIDEHLG